MHDYRLNPFTGNMETVEMVDFHIVPKNQPHYIRLRDIPEKGDPVTTVTVRPFVFVADATIPLTSTAINVDFDLSTPFKEGDIITINEEKMQVTGVAASGISVLRGYDGTIPTVHNRLSTTEPIIAYGPPFAEVPKEPGQGQYQPDYHTKPGGDESWNTGTIRFNAVDAMTWVQVKYNSIGTVNGAEHTGNNSLRDYGYKSTSDIIAVLSGTIALPTANQCQLLYVRKGAVSRATFPGMLIRATGAIVNAGTISANGLAGQGNWGSGGGGGGHNSDGSVNCHSFYYHSHALIRNGVTPNQDQQQFLLELSKSCPIFSGSGGTNGNHGGGEAGGGVALISPYVFNFGAINTHGHGAGGGDQVAAGGGGGGAVVISCETFIQSGTIYVAGGPGALRRWYLSGLGGGWREVWSQSGGAGWIKILEHGGRY